MTHSSANDIAALPPGVKLTALDTGLVIIVRRIFTRAVKPIASSPVMC